jgi:hypothetical protein
MLSSKCLFAGYAFKHLLHGVMPADQVQQVRCCWHLMDGNAGLRSWEY